MFGTCGRPRPATVIIVTIQVVYSSMFWDLGVRAIAVGGSPAIDHPTITSPLPVAPSRPKGQAFLVLAASTSKPLDNPCDNYVLTHVHSRARVTCPSEVYDPRPFSVLVTIPDADKSARGKDVTVLSLRVKRVFSAQPDVPCGASRVCSPPSDRPCAPAWSLLCHPLGSRRVAAAAGGAWFCRPG